MNCGPRCPPTLPAGVTYGVYMGGGYPTDSWWAARRTALAHTMHASGSTNWLDLDLDLDLDGARL